MQAQRTSTPPPNEALLGSPYHTPPGVDAPRSVSMERSPPSPYRVLCIPCAEKAKDIYDRLHGQHVANEEFREHLLQHIAYNQAHALPAPPNPFPVPVSQAAAFNRYVGGHASSHVRPEDTVQSPSAGYVPWPDPFDGVM